MWSSFDKNSIKFEDMCIVFVLFIGVEILFFKSMKNNIS